MKSFLKLIGQAFLIILFTGTVIQAQTERQLENLEAFAKAYGYVKYFHPSDEAEQLDWGWFSVYGSQQVLNCTNSDALRDTLARLFEPIAPTVSFTSHALPKEIVIQKTNPNTTKNYEKIYWQHLGVGKDMIKGSGTYQSVRVNKRTLKKEEMEFGGISTSLNSKEHRGKKFKLTGFAKILQGSQGTGHFWVREDTQEKGMGYFNNMEANPISSSEWSSYEIEGQMGEFSDRLVFGAFLKGGGTFLIDELHLFISQGEEWEEIPLQTSGFESQNWKNTGWGRIGQEYTIELENEDVYSGKQSLRIENPILDLWKKQGPLFEGEPSVQEPWITEIGNQIWINMPLVLYGNKEHTFPVSSKNIENYMLEGEKDTPTDASALEFRLGNIINTWNVFQHFYPYFQEVEVDWNQMLKKQLARTFSSDQQTHQEDLEMLTAALKDGHIHVTGPSTAYFTPPIEWEWINNQLIITKVEDSDLDLIPGEQVESINGEQPLEYFNRLRAKISAPTSGWMAYRSNTQSLMGRQGTKIEIQVNGKTLELNRTLNFYQHKADQKKVNPPFKFLENGIVYINLDIASMDTLNSIMPELEKSEAIIADLRGYPTGNNHILINHLLKKAVNKNWMKISKITYPDRKDLVGFEEMGWKMTPQKPFLGDKKIVFIIDGQAISYAESYMAFIEGYDLATIIGQPTAGTNGGINLFNLPGNYRITFTGMHVQKHDGSQLHGIGILPDIYLEKTVEGIKSGKDEFLQKAIELVSDGKISTQSN